MRYHDSGELHKDFHLATNRTVEYIAVHHGQAMLQELCRRTACDVYRDIHEGLRLGDPGRLLEHLAFYTGREGGRYLCEEIGDGWIFHMLDCPMHRQIIDRGQQVSPYLFDFLSHLYRSWSEDTPFVITVERYSGTAYDIRIGRRDAAE